MPPTSPGAARLTQEPPARYPSAMVNVTNRCNLQCAHCFVYRDGNPNDPDGEMSGDRVLAEGLAFSFHVPRRGERRRWRGTRSRSASARSTSSPRSSSATLTSCGTRAAASS
jgi:hypothetical protein